MQGKLQFWSAFLLVCVLAGFGMVAAQLYRINSLDEVDKALDSRVTALSELFRLPPPPRMPRFGAHPPPVVFNLGPSTSGSPLPQMGPQPYLEGDPLPPPDFRRGLMLPDGIDDSEPEFGLTPEEWIHNQFLERLENFASSGYLNNLFPKEDKAGFYYAIWTPDSTLIRRSASGPTHISRPEANGATQVYKRTMENRREAYRSTELNYSVLVGRSMQPELRARQRFHLLLLSTGLCVLAFALGGTYMLAQKAVQPILRMSQVASRISVSNLAERLSVSDSEPELAELANVLNSTFARLEEAFKLQNRKEMELSDALEKVRLAAEEIQTFQAQLHVVCAWTKRINVEGVWVPIDQFLADKLHVKITHGMSPEAEEQFGGMLDNNRMKSRLES